MDIYCKGVKVSGSPYSVEVFDPKKVGMESMAKESYLHEETEFEGVSFYPRVGVLCIAQYFLENLYICPSIF